MATFLSHPADCPPPQPGDGSFLLHPEHAEGDRTKRRRNRRPKMKSFLESDDDGGVNLHEQARDATAVPRHVPSATVFEVETSLPSSAVVPPTPAGVNQSTPTPYYTNGNETANMASKGVPPHLKKKRSGWPTKEDFPKPDPKRWNTNWDTKGDSQWGGQQDAQWGSGGKGDSWRQDDSKWRQDDSQFTWNTVGKASSNVSIDSAAADGGWGGAQKRRADGESDFKLADWNGGFAPAPIDWDSRPAFRTDQSEDQVQRWLDNCENEWVSDPNLKREVSVQPFEAADGTSYSFTSSGKAKQMGDIIPEYWWKDLTFGREDPQTFWNGLMRSTAPEPEDEDDLQGVRPWWELLHGREFLEEITHPHFAGIDPDETLEERLARENDRGSLKHAENRRNFELAKQQANRDKQKRKQDRTKKLMARQPNSDRAQLPKRLRPGINNLFIRSARPADMTAVLEIFNHYVRNTCATPEIEDRTKEEMLQHYNDAIFAKLPFLVACQKGEVLKGRRRKNRPPEDDIVLPDKVLGFAYADEYNDMKGMYRFTAQIEVYTRNGDCYMKGIASCLLDKMMALLDPIYLERGGYEVCGEELEGAEPKRCIKHVLIHLPFEKPERLEWVSRWLGNFLDFEKVGQLDGVGTKLGKSVGLAIFQRTTGAKVDHANPPPTT